MVHVVVGFPFRDDPHAWDTLNVFLETQEPQKYCDLSFVIVNNSRPNSKIARLLEAHCKSNPQIVWVDASDEPESSCLHKDRVFKTAEELGADLCWCMDSHVHPRRGALEALVKYFQEESRDLLMAPCKNSAWHMQGTNQIMLASELKENGGRYALPRNAVVHEPTGLVFRGDNIGAWVLDPRGLDPQHEPFEIMQQGTFSLACRTEAWPGFHEKMTGYGGNETYLMQRTRDLGGRVMCHPAMTGIHCFMASPDPRYSLMVKLKIKNYIVGFRGLGREDWVQAIIEYFSKIDRIAVREALDNVERGVPLPGFDRVFTENERGMSTRPPTEPNGEPSVHATARAPAKKSVYDDFIEVWRNAGGNVGGSCPKPLFVKLCHVRPVRDDGIPLRTLEFGCGLSTLAFDRQGTQHLALEHVQTWINRVEPLLAHPETTRIELSPLDQKTGWYTHKFESRERFDLILVDGPPGQLPNGRKGAIKAVPELLDHEGVVILDDTHRKDEAAISAKIMEALKARDQRFVVALRRVPYGARKFDVIEVTAPGPGTLLTMIFAEETGASGCTLGCKDLAVRMDELGVAGCREIIDELVTDILPRAQEWLKREGASLTDKAKAKAPEWAQRIGLRRYVERAIAQAEEVQKILSNRG